MSLSDEVKQTARLFYDKLDDAIAHAFSTTNGDTMWLPPTKYAFHYHMLRALLKIIFHKAAQLNVQLMCCGWRELCG